MHIRAHKETMLACMNADVCMYLYACMCDLYVHTCIHV
jgi:hypothetical protein